MKITALVAALTLSAGALAQQTTPSTPGTPGLNPPSNTTPGTTTPGTTTPGTTSPSTTPGAPATGTGSRSGLSSKNDTAQQWPTFESLDTNADGKLSASEAAASTSLSAKFSSLDKQGRGYLTREDYQMASRGVDNSKNESSASDR